MAFKPTLRDVLPTPLHQPARTALTSSTEATASTPWFVRILTGFGAWLASWFLIAFVALGVLGAGEEVGAIVLGLILTGVAVLVRHAGGNVFLTQLALSTGLAGQGLFIGGVAVATDEKGAALATVVIQAVLLFVYPDLIQRFLSTYFGGLALLFLLRHTAPAVLTDVTLVGFTVLAHLLLLKQAQLQNGRWSALVTPVVFGLFTTLMSSLVMRSWFHEIYREIFRKGATEMPTAVLTLGFAVVTLYSAWRVLEETDSEPGGPAGVTAFASLALTALLTLHTPGVIAATGVLLLGFHRRNVVLLGMAVVFILAFGVGYYYDLQLSLLAKSLALLASGLVLLGLRLFILRRFPAAEEVR
jgi:MFS family permease